MVPVADVGRLDRPRADPGPRRPAGVAFGVREGLAWVTSSLAGIRALVVLAAIGGGLAVGVATAYKPKIGIALVIGIAGALVVLRRLEIGGLLLVSVAPDLSGLRRGFPIPSLRLTEALTAGVATLVFLFLRRSRAVPWTRVEWLAVAFSLGGFAIGLYDAHRLGAHLGFQDYGTLIGPFQFFLLFRSIRVVMHSERWRNRALRVFLYSSVPVSLLAIAQQLKVPKVRSFVVTMTGSDVLVGPGSGYSSFNRATGPFPHWTPLAGYLTVILVLSLCIVMQRDFDPLPRRRLYTVMVLDAIAMAFTAELSAIIGMVLALILIGAMTHQLRRILEVAAVVVLMVSMIVGPFLASRIQAEYTKKAGTSHSSLIPQTIEFRLSIWDHQYFPAIGDRPVLGYGVVNPPMVDWPATESQYVTILERGGAVLMGLYIALMLGLASAGFVIFRSIDDPLARVTGLSVAVMVIILVPMNSIFPYFEDSGLPQALWVLVGISMACVRGRLPSIGSARMDAWLRRSAMAPDDQFVPSGLLAGQGLRTMYGDR